jgi:hypothetical protein
MGKDDLQSGAGLVKTFKMRSSTVAFRGSRQVVDAYAANDMPSWAICNGKDIMFAQEADSVDDGQVLLGDILKKMQTGGSRACFTLRVYELKKGEKINSSTAFSRSFPFALYNDEDEYSPFEHGRRTYAKEADERILELQTQIDQLKEKLAEEEQEAPEGGVNGFIAGVLQDPYMKNVLMQALAGIVQKVVPMPRQQAAAVAGIESGEGQTMASVLEPGQPELVQQALYQLCAKDPRLGDHLMKLASIAMNNPQQFNMLIGMLKNF